MVQHHDSVPSLNCTAISIDSPHMHRDGANYLNLLLNWIHQMQCALSPKILSIYRSWSQCLKTKISLLKISRHTPSYLLRNSARFLNWRRLNCARFRLKFYRSEEILVVEIFLPGWVEAAKADLGYHSTDGQDTLCFCLKESGNFYIKRIEA